MRFPPSPWIVAAAAAALAGCGAKVAVDNPGGGGGGSGGATTSSSSSTSASSSSTSASSTSSSTSASSSSTGGMGCPDPFPGIEAHCDTEGLMCPVPNACCSGGAICKGGFWVFGGVPCGQPCTPDCGPDGFACQAGTICVAYIGMITTYQCRVSPCFEMIDCNCTEPYCEEQGMKCNNIQDGFKVLCD